MLVNSSINAYDVPMSKQEHNYFVYIMTNRSGTLYVGVTNNLINRVHQHKTRTVPGFTARYKIDKLLYFESFRDVGAAIAREKVIKGWTRKKKLALIAHTNPDWHDLAADWYD